MTVCLIRPLPSLKTINFIDILKIVAGKNNNDNVSIRYLACLDLHSFR